MKLEELIKELKKKYPTMTIELASEIVAREVRGKQSKSTKKLR